MTLSVPHKSGVEVLNFITCVGPKLEGILNDLGFRHFDQIAKWSESQIVWVDNALKFKGRIIRDDWMYQASKLGKI